MLIRKDSGVGVDKREKESKVVNHEAEPAPPKCRRTKPVALIATRRDNISPARSGELWRLSYLSGANCFD